MALFVSRVYEVWARTNERELLVLNQVPDAPLSEKKVAMVGLGLLGHAHVHDFYLTKRESNFSYGVPHEVINLVTDDVMVVDSYELEEWEIPPEALSKEFLAELKRNVGNGGRNVKRLPADAFKIEELEHLSGNICMMARIQQTDSDSENESSYESAFINEVQNPSTSFMNPLYSQSDHEQMYHQQQKIIKPTIGNDQINSDIILDDPNVEVHDGKFEHDKDAHDQQDNAMELLARNAYREGKNNK
ncbi:hypothetical protein Tco_0475593 [Tanacetum coccineum]